VLRAPLHLSVPDSLVGQRLPDALDESGDLSFTVLAALVEPVGNVVVGLGIHKAQAQVLQFPLDLVDA